MGRHTSVSATNLVDQYEAILCEEGLAVIPLQGGRLEERDPIDCPLGNKRCRLGGASCEGGSECPLTSSIYED